MDLLSAIKVPFDDMKTQFFEPGLDGFPAMGIRPGSDIKTPHRLFLPEKFFPEFSIAIIAKMMSTQGGYLFAVVNPLDTVRAYRYLTLESKLSQGLKYTDETGFPYVTEDESSINCRDDIGETC
jgi:hypothetical protein